MGQGFWFFITLERTTSGRDTCIYECEVLWTINLNVISYNSRIKSVMDFERQSCPTLCLSVGTFFNCSRPESIFSVSDNPERRDPPWEPYSVLSYYCSTVWPVRIFSVRIQACFFWFGLLVAIVIKCSAFCHYMKIIMNLTLMFFVFFSI